MYCDFSDPVGPYLLIIYINDLRLRKNLLLKLFTFHYDTSVIMFYKHSGDFYTVLFGMSEWFAGDK